MVPIHQKVVKGKAISVSLDNRLTDGSKVVSFTCLQPFTPRKMPDTLFCYSRRRPLGHSAAGMIM
jgi:hypothetical protein